MREEVMISGEKDKAGLKYFVIFVETKRSTLNLTFLKRDGHARENN